MGGPKGVSPGQKPLLHGIEGLCVKGVQNQRLAYKLVDRYYRGVTPFGPPMWQAEADTELTLSASPTTAVGQKALALAKRRYSPWND